MRQFVVRLALMSAALLFFTGCIAQQAETTINADGSGTNVIRVGFSQQAMAMISGMDEGNSEDPFADLRGQEDSLPAEWNAQLNDWEDETFTGIEIAMEFADLPMLQAQLDQMFGGSDPNSPGNITGGSLYQNIRVEEINDEIVITAVADTSGMGLEEQGMDASMFADASLFWEVTMPGTIQEYTAQEIAIQEGNTVRWTFPLDQPDTYDLRVVGAKSGGIGGASPLVLVLGGAGALLLVAGLVMFFMNRSTARPATATTYNSGPGATGTYAGNDYNQATNDDNQAGYAPSGNTYDPASYAPPPAETHDRGDYQQPTDDVPPRG